MSQEQKMGIAIITICIVILAYITITAPVAMLGTLAVMFKN